MVAVGRNSKESVIENIIAMCTNCEALFFQIRDILAPVLLEGL